MNLERMAKETTSPDTSSTVSASDASTSGGHGSSGTRSPGSMSPATTLLANDFQLQDLPDRILAIAITLGRMQSEGWTKQEIAEFYGRSRSWVSARLSELEDELRKIVSDHDEETKRREELAA